MKKITFCLAFLFCCSFLAHGQPGFNALQKQSNTNNPERLIPIGAQKNLPEAAGSIPLSTASSASSSTDNPRTCSTDERHTEMMQDPAFAQQYNQSKNNVSQELLNKTQAPCATPLVIPVVVHFESGTISNQCMIDASLAQIAQINLDYAGCNTNAGMLCDFINAGCDNFGGTEGADAMPDDGACIQFCLADQNLPAAETTIGGFAITAGDYNSNSQNASNNWQGYFNVYVGTAGGALGFVPFLSGANNANNTQGASILTSAFGAEGFTGCEGVGTDTQFGNGATLTHEAGHWFGLEHSFSDTYVDTPPQTNPNYGCPVVDLNNCTTSAGADYNGNFMDYVDDNCMFTFTQDQADIMIATGDAQPNWNTNSISCFNNGPTDPYPPCGAAQAGACVICDHTIAVATSCDADGISYTATVTITAGTGPFTVTSSGGGTVSGSGTTFTVSGIPTASTISVNDTGEADCIQNANVVTPCCAALGFTAPAGACSGETITLAAPATCGFTGTPGTSPLDAGATGTYPVVLVDITPTPTPNLTTLDFSALDVGGFLANNPSSDGALVFPDPCGNFDYIATNNTCDIQYIHFIVTEFDGEAADGTFTADCQSAVVTVELFPEPAAPVLVFDNCQVILTGTCADDVVTVGGGNGSGTSGNVATYDYADADDITIDVANANGCVTIFTFTTPAPPAPVLTCPATASCETDAPLSADLVPEEFGFIDILINFDTYPEETGIQLDGVDVFPAGTFAGATGSQTVSIGPLPIGSYTITITDTFGDGQDAFNATDIVGSHEVFDQGSGVSAGSASANWGTAVTYTVDVTTVVVTTGVWSGTGVTDNTDGTATFNSASNGTFTATYAYTDESGCEATVTCDIVVSDCVATCTDQPTVTADPTATICSDETLDLTMVNAVFGGSATAITWTTAGDGTVVGTTSYTPGTADIAAGTVTLTVTTDFVDPCVAATADLVLTINTAMDVTEMASLCAENNETYTASTGTVYTASGTETFTDANGCTATLTVTIMNTTPACGDPTATNFDMDATCIDNTLCTFGEYCDNICFAEFAANPSPNDTPNATLCVTPLGCADLATIDPSCISTQTCDDADPCTAGEQETFIIATSTACDDCGLNATPVTPACGDPTATNFDMDATCIDNTLCTFGVCEDAIAGMVTLEGCDFTGAMVTIYDDSGAIVDTAMTDATGNYSLAGPFACGTYSAELTAAPPCYTDEGGDLGPRQFSVNGDGVADGFNFAPIPANIPTVGEWGLIILGLMMSIVAIVGIREKRTNEVYS